MRSGPSHEAGNTPTSPEDSGVATVGKNQGWGIPSFKPQAQDRSIRLFQLAEKLDVIAIGVDLEGAGSTLDHASKKSYRNREHELQETRRLHPKTRYLQGYYEQGRRG